MMSNDERANAMCVIQRFTFMKILALYIYIYIPQYTSLNEADETGKRIPDRVTRRIERLSPGYVSENSACHPVNAVSRF